MSTFVIVYALGFLAFTVVYARWVAWSENRIAPGLPPDRVEQLLLGALVALVWPVGWLAIVCADVAAGLYAVRCPRPIRWLERQIFRGL